MCKTEVRRSSIFSYALVKTLKKQNSNNKQIMQLWTKYIFMSEAVLFPKTLQKHMLMFSTTKLARNSCNKLVKAESSTLRYNDRLIPSLDNTIPCKTLQHLPFRFFPITWVTSHNHLNFNFIRKYKISQQKRIVSYLKNLYLWYILYVCTEVLG